MELYDVMRTTFAARQFTADPLPDDVLAKILDHARFAPSGAGSVYLCIAHTSAATIKNDPKIASA